MNTKLSSATLISLLSSVLVLVALPAQADFYEVEMTVFTNEGAGNINEQTWPKNIKVDYPQPLASLSNKEVDDIYPELTNPNRPSANPYLIPLLGKEFSQHEHHVSKLEQSGQHRILFSKTWLEKIESAEFAKNIIIQGGKLETNTYELGGMVNLYKTNAPNTQNPVLHVKTRLWQVTFGDASDAPMNGWPIPLGYTITDEGITPMNIDKSVRIRRIGVLNADEIINQSTLHYIDHPLFGVLIEIRPYSAIKMND